MENAEELNHDFIEFLKDEAELNEDQIKVLNDAGFDDFESLRLAQLETIQILGFQDPQQVFQQIQHALKSISLIKSSKRDLQALNQGVLQQDNDQILDLQKQMEEMKVQHREKAKQIVQHQQSDQQQIQLDGKSISIQMIIGVKEFKKGKANIESQLQKITHLHLEDKNIELIENIQECKKLSHVYLQQNLIYTLVNDPFKGLKNIVQLSLYDNRIDKMEGFSDLVNLKKLYLEKNQIQKLEGLENCRKLEELNLGHQMIYQGHFEFDEYSLAAISETLKNLEIPNSNVVNIKSLYYLEQLDNLNLQDNQIIDFEAEVCPVLQTMNSLKTFNLKNNPVTQITKYRDQVVLLSRSIEELDGKDISDQERKYLVSLISRKKVQGTVYNNIKKKKENLQVQGQLMEIHNQKQFQYNNEDSSKISFAKFCKMFGKGDDPQNVDNDFDEYIKYIDEQKQGKDLSTNENLPPVGVGKSKNINSNTDFTIAGMPTSMTKHVPHVHGKQGPLV